MVKIYKEIQVCRDSHLQEKGWFQACFSCCTITSKTFVYSVITHKNYIYEFNVYLCPCCSKRMKQDLMSFIKFSAICNRYIKKKYKHLFSLDNHPDDSRK